MQVIGPLTVTQLISASSNYAIDTGATNAYVVTLGLTALVSGLMLAFKATNSNSGASTINVDGLGVKNIYKGSASGPVVLTSGDIVANNVYVVVYDGTQYQLAGGSGGGSGTSGFSGYSGTAGSSGATGTSGFSGFSGTNGSAGATGTSGFSGFSGTAGSTGSTGTSGFSGFSGTAGSAGGTGTSGFSGFSGTAGSTGSTGTSGFSGYSGTAGSTGSTGSTGTSGFSGYSGQSGTSGFSGVSGYSGYSGKSGYSGISGFSGYSGTAGSTGSTGTSGFSGVSGFSGYSGTAGSTGSTGTSGFSGVSGFSGYSGVGTSGFSGVSGWSGANPGASGYSGVSGYSGKSGYSGYSGLYSTAFVTLTDQATITTDCSLGNSFKVTLGGNRTLANPTNATDGQVIRWEINQDGTGGRTLALDTNFVTGPFGTIVFTATISAYDILTCVYDSTKGKFIVTSWVPASGGGLAVSGYSGRSGYSGVSNFGSQVLQLTGDQSTSSQSLGDITGLASYSLVASATYYFRLNAVVQTNATTVGILLSVNCSGAVSAINWVSLWPTSATAWSSGQFTALDGGTLPTTGPGTTNTQYILEGTITTSGAVTMAFRYRSETATSTTVKAGTVGLVTRIS